jgi:hypothetical protein
MEKGNGSETGTGTALETSDDWQPGTGTAPPGFTGLTPAQEIGRLEEAIAKLNEHAQELYDHTHLSEAEVLWTQARRYRRRVDELRAAGGSAPPSP